MNQKITLYHGSEQLVETPTFGLGKKNNDFGLGFYCTESEELAKEWAVSSLRNGFANAAEPEDARDLATQRMRERKRATEPLRVMQVAVRFDKTTARHQHECHGDIRHVIGEHVRRVRDADVAFFAPRHRHAVIAHTHHADDLQLRKGRELVDAELRAA